MAKSSLGISASEPRYAAVASLDEQRTVERIIFLRKPQKKLLKLHGTKIRFERSGARI